MAVTLRPYINAGLTLATVGAIAVVPSVAAPLSGVPVASPAVELTAGDESSLLNVPLNLFQDIVNIPYNQVGALDVMAQSLLFTGPWFVGSPTNVWGEDPGDPGHFESLVDLYVPFPALSGQGHEGDYAYPGLGQQLAMLAAVELPANPACESLDCLPLVPTSPITGITGVDQTLWSVLALFFGQKFPLIDNWFKVPLSEMTQGDGYYFSPGAPASIDSGPAYAYPGFPWPGTHNPSPEELAQYPNLTPDTNLMPWAGTDFKLDPAAPFQNFFTSLQEPFDPSKFELPNPVDFARALQALLGGAFLDFNPFVYGSPLCLGACVLPDGSQTYYGFIRILDALWPGNKLLEEWMTLDNQGIANVSTPEIRDYLAWVWQHQAVLFDFNNEQPPPYGNPLPPDPVIDTSSLLPTMNEVNTYIADHFGSGLQVFLDNVGVLGPFDSDNLMNLFFPPAAVPDPSSASAVADVADSMASLIAQIPAGG
ncbi:MAG TPA: hypothetical protein VFR27_00650 [Mycobacterium sp.]|nr:hypothetical protein [Mycobacterium sp.]